MPPLRGARSLRRVASPCTRPDPRLPDRGPGMAYYEGPKGDFLLGEFQLTADGRPSWSSAVRAQVYDLVLPDARERHAFRELIG